MDICHSFKVLLIEDDSALSLFFIRSMRRAGFEVSLCERGDSGLETALAGAFDVIVVDCHLPGLAGIGVVAGIRAALLPARILMLTGSGEFARREAIAAGADAFLGKPCGMDELIAAIKDLAESERNANPATCAG